MSTMTEAAQQYLRLRRSLGYKLEVPGRLVLSFAGHLDALGIAHVTADAAAAWATAPRNAEPYWHWLRMSAVRGFAVYLHSLDSRHRVLSAYDLTCRSAYDLTCWFAGSLAG